MDDNGAADCAKATGSRGLLVREPLNHCGLETLHRALLRALNGALMLASYARLFIEKPL